jgi:hypothetical protein
MLCAIPVNGTQVRGFSPGGFLNVRVRAGDIHIRPGQSDEIKLVWKVNGDDPERQAEQTQLWFDSSGSIANIQVTGPAHNGVDLDIEVPAQTNLKVKLSYGDVKIEGVDGDKSVDVHFGDVQISLNPKLEYASVDASVHTGDVNTPWRERSSVLFGTSVKRLSSGKYNLHAHVGVGDVTLH